jgi:hypothetical protein
MKEYIILVTSLFWFNFLFSQNVSHIAFTYDSAGNRETREVIYLKTTEVEDAESTNPGTFGQVTDTVAYKGTLGNREISIYPNPTKGSLTIAIAGEEEACPATLALISISGEMILRHQIRQPSTTLVLSGHPPGTYLLQITTAAGRETWKVVKE